MQTEIFRRRRYLKINHATLTGFEHADMLMPDRKTKVECTEVDGQLSQPCRSAMGDESSLPVLIPCSHLCGSSRSSLQFYEYFCRPKAAVVLRKIAVGLRFDCGQYGSFAVFAVHLRFNVVAEPQRTAT